MILSQLLKAYREKKGITLMDMASEIGVAYDALYRFEQGKAIQMRHLMGILKWVLAS